MSVKRTQVCGENDPSPDREQQISGTVRVDRQVSAVVLYCLRLRVVRTTAVARTAAITSGTEQYKCSIAPGVRACCCRRPRSRQISRSVTSDPPTIPEAPPVLLRLRVFVVVAIPPLNTCAREASASFSPLQHPHSCARHEFSRPISPRTGLCPHFPRSIATTADLIPYPLLPESTYCGVWSVT